MTERRRVGGVRRGRTLLLLALLLAAGGLGGPASASGQFEQLLTQRQLDYDAARHERDARRAEWDAQQQRWQSTLNEINALKQSGGGERLEAALQRSYLQALELQRLSRRVVDAEAVLEERRTALEEALDFQREALDDRLSRASPAQRSSLAVSIRSLDAQYQELQEEKGFRPQLVYFPAVDWDPRDDPEELLAKAQLLERQIAGAQDEIQRVDQEVDRLEGRMRIQRRAADAAATLSRFEDTNLPVGPTPRPGGEVSLPEGSGDTAVPLAQRPLDQQIEALREIRALLVERQEQLRVRVATIRGRLTGAGREGPR